MKIFATKLTQAKGQGSSKHGVSHWWAQRVSAVLLVPLVIWFVVGCALYGPQSSYTDWVKWLTQPVSMGLFVVFIGAVLYHGQLGMQVVIEDYIHHVFWRLTFLFANKVAALGGFVAVIISLLQLKLALVALPVS